ncbi:hypothetical protein Y032_0401g782 [Ancylostoma ceylanicum]|uniref:Uncharacterized protein n=1 Tax=Ancylostoma ceylanicum TaxID=53326 RepID=A0A016X328_9BILA|nr:hypothetical protein Y032_0401g782 [Ancylostoma ceylanicum]
MSSLLHLKSGLSRVISTRSVTSYQSNPDLANALHKWTGGTVELTSSGSVARLQLNRPEKSNCLSGEMMIQFRQKAEVRDFV